MALRDNTKFTLGAHFFLANHSVVVSLFRYGE